MSALAYSAETNLTAIVHAADGIHFVAAASCPEALSAQIVDYVLERCDHTLWPSVSAQVRSLVDDDKPYAAIALYFENVGERWDEERLELGGLSFGAPRLATRPLAEVG